ncbi:Vgb family protein [Nitrosopumilus sp. S6]
MKKQTKGILAFAFLGGIMVTSGVVIAIPGLAPDEETPEITITGTPADNFPDEDRPRFCGSGNAKSTDFVTEYSIPTDCTNPLAIVTDYDGNVWFAQTNTGKLAKFDPTTETFTEYDNPTWPKNGRSMMWGIDYAPDGSVWFTDETFDSVWKFSTLDEKYDRLGYPSETDSLPQRLHIDGSQIIINDFTGNKLTFFDIGQSTGDVEYISLPSPVDNSVTADFTLDSDGNVWYTNWLFQQGGVLIKFDQNGYRNAVQESGQEFFAGEMFTEIYQLPVELLTPNGAVISNDGKIWLADTTSSSFFSFDPITEEFTQYVTADPLLSTYGNQTGVIKTPISRPYWIDSDDQGRIIFNEQNANNISIFDPKSNSLVEYHVPSKNPYWGDCDPGTGLMVADCGLAQIFDFAVDGEKIWFTEWVENNIGVVDTSVPLPLEIQLGSDTLFLSSGDMDHVPVLVYPKTSNSIGASVILSSTHDFLKTKLTHNSSETFQLDSNEPQTIHVDIMATDDAVSGTYKILVGVQTSDVAIGKFITVTIE